jgi:hypothetical protein
MAEARHLQQKPHTSSVFFISPIINHLGFKALASQLLLASTKRSIPVPSCLNKPLPSDRHTPHSQFLFQSQLLPTIHSSVSLGCTTEAPSSLNQTPLHAVTPYHSVDGSLTLRDSVTLRPSHNPTSDPFSPAPTHLSVFGRAASESWLPKPGTPSHL